MVEALVSLVVLSIGLLGIAALYLDSLRAGRTAIYRTQAVNLAADLADRVRANRGAGVAYVAAFADAPTAVANLRHHRRAACLPTWLQRTSPAGRRPSPSSLPGGEGEVDVTAPAVAGDPATYVVTIRWVEVGQDIPAQFQLRLET